MALTAGTRVGAYEVLSLLGAGGMGEVYRARDAKLNRDVALKVLPESVTHDVKRAALLRREAQVLASLNHPHIGAIYGLEDSDGLAAMVLELVEGPTLADRIADGPVALDEALPIAKQIAEALAAAHELGVVHRDLKPANIKLGPDGAVKVLDFGLAKVADPLTSPLEAAHLMTMTAREESVSGVIKGTPAYMSPEQASGNTVDRRTDIWAFGLVLLEMLTGERTFTGESVTHVIAAVLREEPDWSRLPVNTPPAIRRLLKRCLEKSKKLRLDSATVVRMELEDVGRIGESSLPVAASRAVTWIAILAAVLGAVLTAGITWSMTRPPARVPPALARFTITTPVDLFVTPSLQAVARDFAVAPNGAFLVYRAGAQGRLAVRWLDRLEIATIPGVTSASMPFVSPDSAWIGYVDDTLTLKKVPVAGGAPVTLANLPVWPRGATWIDDATIVIGTNSEITGLLRVPAGGGEPVVLTKPDRSKGEEGHVLPSMLPGGREVLFTIGGAEPAKAQIALLDLQTGTYRTLLTGGRDAQYVASGHLVYLAGLALSAVRFDLDRRTVAGDPVRVLDGVAVAPTSSLNVAVTAAGTMVSLPARQGAASSRVLTWVDRQGRETPIGAPARPYESARLSPDGTRVAVSIRDQENDLWVWSLPRQTLTRETFDPDVDLAPVWTPDSRRIVFASPRTGVYNLYARDVDGTAPDVRITYGANTQLPTSITPDGAQVICQEVRPKTRADVARYTLSANSTADDLVSSPFDEWNAQVSPDGRFLAYQSDESGAPEVYVRSFPDTATARWQVSSGGGSSPAWTRGGRELIYLDEAQHLTSVTVDGGGATFHTSPPVTISRTTYADPGHGAWRSYDVSADGQRLLVIKQEAAPQPAALPVFVVVQNWLEELKRLVPSR